jgi:hypothetical protein
MPEANAVAGAVRDIGAARETNLKRTPRGHKYVLTREHWWDEGVQNDVGRMAGSCGDSANLASEEVDDSARAGIEIAEHAVLPRIKESGITGNTTEDDGAHRN